MSSTPNREDWKKLYAAAAEIRRLEPWKWMFEDQIMAVIDPDGGDTGYCCVLGAAGQLNGMVVYMGDEGLATYLAMVNNPSQVVDPELASRQRALVVYYNTKDELPRTDLAITRTLMLNYKGGDVWPFFRSYLPGRQPLALSAAQARFLAIVLHQLHDVSLRVREDSEMLGPFESGEIFTRAPEQDAEGNIVWRDEYIMSSAVEQSMYDMARTFPDDALERMKVGLKQTKAIWEFGCFRVPFPPEENLPELYILIISEAGGEKVISSQMSPKQADGDLLRIMALGVMTEQQERPAAIHVDNDDALQALEHACQVLGVDLVRRDQLTLQAKMNEGFSALLERVDEKLNGTSARVDEVSTITNQFCAEHLDDEYARLCRKVIARLDFVSPHKFVKGKPKQWAAGILYQVGMQNMLFDPLSPFPHMEAEELCRILGVKKKTAESKSDEIVKLLDISEPFMQLLRDDVLTMCYDKTFAVKIEDTVYDAHELPEKLQVGLYEDEAMLPWVPFECAMEKISRHLPFDMIARGPLVDMITGRTVNLKPGTHVNVIEVYYEYPEDGIVSVVKLSGDRSQQSAPSCAVPIIRLDPIDGQPVAELIRKYQHDREAGEKWLEEYRARYPEEEDDGILPTESTRKFQPTSVYRLKITLEGIAPPVWRRLEVPGDMTLGQLHLVIQGVMPWDNSHLHEFMIRKQRYGMPEDNTIFSFGINSNSTTVDEDEVRIDQVLTRAKMTFNYMYDFGDSWSHQIVVENIAPPEKNVTYPRCIEGERAGPPEDSGGVWGYQDNLDVLANPKHPEYEDVIEWMGEDWDPERFDLDEVNARLKQWV